MVDYEKGSSAWDIGMVFARHPPGCARRKSLELTAASVLSPAERLRAALNIACSCGMGDSEAERTSLRAARVQP